MQRISPCLWFDGQAEEAANFYVSVFGNSKLGDIMRFGAGGPGPAGSVLSVTFQLEGQEFIALNGGPHFKFTPALSLFVKCRAQTEVDELWEKLSAGGQTQKCAWLTDRYGVSWQIVPTVLGELLQLKDPEKAKKVMQAMMQMDKIDIAALKRAAAG